MHQDSEWFFRHPPIAAVVRVARSRLSLLFLGSARATPCTFLPRKEQVVAPAFPGSGGVTGEIGDSASPRRQEVAAAFCAAASDPRLIVLALRGCQPKITSPNMQRLGPDPNGPSPPGGVPASLP